MTIEDVVHAESSIDPSVSGEIHRGIGSRGVVHHYRIN